MMLRPRPRQLAPVKPDAKQHLESAKRHLVFALAHARAANCGSFAAKIRSALKSWDGARRHLDRRIRNSSPTQ